MRTFGLHRPHLFIFFSLCTSPSVRIAHPLWHLASALSQIWERPYLAGGQMLCQIISPLGLRRIWVMGLLGLRDVSPEVSPPSLQPFKGIPSLFLLPQPFPSQEYSCSSRPHRAALVISIPLLCTLPTRSNPPTLFPSHLLIFCDPFLQASLALFGRDSFPKQCLSYQECLEDFIWGYTHRGKCFWKTTLKYLKIQYVLMLKIQLGEKFLENL